MAPHAPPTQRDMSFRRPAADTLLVRLAGRWLLRDGLPTINEIQQQLDTPPRVRQLAFARAVLVETQLDDRESVVGRAGGWRGRPPSQDRAIGRQHDVLAAVRPRDALGAAMFMIVFYRQVSRG